MVIIDHTPLLKKRMREYEEIKFCLCGCGERISPNRWTGKYANYINHHYHISSHSTETREKLRGANLGKSLSTEHRKNISSSMIGKNTWMKGRKFSKETIRKMLESRKGYRPSKETKRKIALGVTGERNFNWKGGISKSLYDEKWSDKEFRKQVIEYYDNKCQNPLCWGTAKRKSLHHIDYDKKNTCFKNIILTCASCNSRANKDREFWKKLYSEIKAREGK